MCFYSCVLLHPFPVALACCVWSSLGGFNLLHDLIGWYIRGQLGFNIELRGKRHPILYTCGTHVLMEPHIYTHINI